jgi:PTH1 family peptidyl-tRNA hydrolase
MYLIIGLGNPEEEYSKTRHNMGFNAINKIARKYGIEINKNKYQGLYETAIIERKKVVLLKPQTYMNLSGNCVQEFVNFYKIEKENIIVLYDDMDIESGQIKIRKKGSSRWTQWNEINYTNVRHRRVLTNKNRHWKA